VCGESADIRRRHAEYYLAFVEQAEPELPLSPRELLDRLELEHDNIRAALEWLEAAGDRERLLRMTGAAWRFWYLRGHLTEGRRRIEAALTGSDEATLGRAKTLNGAAALAMNVGDLAGAKARASEAVTLHRHLGDALGAAYGTFMLANVLGIEGEAEPATRAYEEAIGAFRDFGADHWALLAARHLAYRYDDLGERARARALHEENLRLARASGNDRFVATSLGALARYAIEARRLEDAAVLLEESVRVHQRLGDVLDAAVDLSQFARILVDTGRPEAAAAIASSLDTIIDRIGVRGTAVGETNAETIASSALQLDEAALADACERGRALSFDAAIELALEASTARARRRPPHEVGRQSGARSVR
jgi:non-specific serine/threonine protein kinase